MLEPEYYTESETKCNWKKFEPEKPWHCTDFHLLEQRSRTSVIIKGLSVHSLAFDDPVCGFGNFLRWDCINGFNQPRVKDDNGS